MNTSQTNRIITARTSTRSETPAGPLWLQGAVQKNGRSVLELKLPPVALGAVSAVLMWSTSSAAPAFDFIFPAKAMYSASLALMGALTCLAGVVSFRRAKTTVNPMKPDAASSLVVSGIYRYTRNPMYAGFLLILLGLGGVSVERARAGRAPGVCSVYEPFPDLPGRACACCALRR